MSEQRRCVVIGIGNSERGDDAAGRAVAQRLTGMLSRGVEVVEREQATALLAAIDGAAAVFVVDACASGAPAGTIHRFDATMARLPDLAFAPSTHSLGLTAAIELARALGELPAHCIVYAIEGGSFDVGAPLSPPVSEAIVEVAQRLYTEVSALAPAELPP